ncbi:MAG: hypothetical protein WDM78_12040 [Puia sp.]
MQDNGLYQHILIIIRFEECGMALFKIMDQPFAGRPDIREHADIGFSCTNNKTMGVAGIVFLLKAVIRRSPICMGCWSVK